VPKAGRPRRPRPAAGELQQPARTPILGTAIQAAAELAEIGLALGGRALRRTIDRLPRP
jgi:hypothetical protein